MKTISRFLNEDKFDLTNTDVKILGMLVNWLEDNPRLKTNFIRYANDIDTDDIYEFIETWNTEFHGNSH